MASFTVDVPPKFKSLVARGDRIRLGQVLAGIVLNKASIAGPIALHNLLEVKPKDIKKFLVKADGETVVKGETIAQKRGLFSSIRVKSPTDGVLRILKERNGFVQIKPTSQETITSPVEGTVRKVTAKVGIIIDTESIVFTGIAGREDASGELFKVEDSGNIFSINKKVADKIVVGDHFDEATVTKIKALGGVGVIIDSELNIKNIPYIVVEKIADLNNYVGEKVKIVNNGGHYLVII